MVRAVAEVARLLLYLLPPAFALLFAALLLVAPFMEGWQASLGFFVLATPGYLGVAAAPGYFYALLDDPRATNVTPRVRRWVRVSLGCGFVGSTWATAILGIAWRELWPLVSLTLLSALTSLRLMQRFEFGAPRRFQAEAATGG
jgi:hypothetical protein